jgi:hypothetical protein
MPWRLEGTYFENCNCDMVCPCTTSGQTAPADYDRCHVALAFHVNSGDVDGVDVSGLTVAVVADTPPLMSEGNWRVAVLMDAAASQEQAEALGAVFSGQRGGPMSGLAPLIGEMLGMEVAPVEYADDGRRHRVRIGNAIDLEVEDFVSPFDPTGAGVKISGVGFSSGHRGGGAGNGVAGECLRPRVVQRREELLLGTIRLVGLSASRAGSPRRFPRRLAGVARRRRHRLGADCSIRDGDAAGSRAAMMLPSVAPVITLYQSSLLAQASGWTLVLRSVGVVVGHLAAWAIFGVVAYFVALGGSWLAARAPNAGLWVGALLLAAAGIYQLTPLKDRCLKHCRSPLGFLLHFGNYQGPLRDLRVGTAPIASVAAGA